MKTENLNLFHGDCLDLLKQIPNDSIQLVVTSPPYNIGKKYEKKMSTEDYVCFQSKVITECHRVLKPRGSICWQVGNYVKNSAIVPIDIILYPVFQKLQMKMRNRIIWHFGHGLHASKRFSGRYETIVWFTKSDDYFFNLDPIRVPQKYPNKKHFKGEKKGELSCNPLGKNPSDIWNIPNVKNNHVEKTDHPCQFPLALVERLILSMTEKEDVVLDPFMGSGSTGISALLNGRKFNGAEIEAGYYQIAVERCVAALNGNAKIRPINKLIYSNN